jgi:phosphatidylserine/phosphatidylglycerophosphate/cardiolipin synthase-like enzyme
MKRIFFIFVFLFTSFYLFAQDFELVESVPVETFMEQSNLPRCFDVWLKMINEAKSTIDIETFYFSSKPGEPLEDIISALKSAAGRGIKIRIIVDSSFYAKNEKSSDLLEGLQNIEIRKIPFGNIGGGVMHAKYFIVDGENLFLGSQNMDWRAIKHIHEIGLRIKSKKFVWEFINIFENDWRLCKRHNSADIENLLKVSVSGFSEKHPLKLTDKNYGSLLLYSAFSPYNYIPGNFNTELDEILKLIKYARKRLNIQIYSYSTKGEKSSEFDKIDKALRKAAKRGVKIKIIFPDWATGKKSIDVIKNLSQVKNIKIKISSIPQYSGGFIPYSRVEHCKYFISDNNYSFISTSNWEDDYFYKSRNASVIIKNGKVNSELKKVFNSDWNGPLTEPIDVSKDYKPPKRN